MPGFKNTHLSSVLNVAANMRTGDPRLIDLPARVLLRYQGRAAVDIGAIKADLDRLLGAEGASAGSAAPTAAAPVSRRAMSAWWPKLQPGAWWSRPSANRVFPFA
jgi:hypothetical protein